MEGILSITNTTDYLICLFKLLKAPPHTIEVLTKKWYLLIDFTVPPKEVSEYFEQVKLQKSCVINLISFQLGLFKDYFFSIHQRC